MKLLIDAKANINAESVRAAHVPPGRAAASARLALLSPLARRVERRGGERAAECDSGVMCGPRVAWACAEGSGARHAVAAAVAARRCGARPRQRRGGE